MLYQWKSCTKVSRTLLLCIVCKLLSIYLLDFSPGYPSQNAIFAVWNFFLPQLSSLYTSLWM